MKVTENLTATQLDTMEATGSMTHPGLHMQQETSGKYSGIYLYLMTSGGHGGGGGGGGGGGEAYIPLAGPESVDHPLG